MALPPLASVADLEARLPTGDLTESDDVRRAEAALADASALVRSEAGRTWVGDDDELDGVPDIVTTVVLAVAQRRLNGSFTYGSDGTAQQDFGLYLKRDERAAIRSAIGLGGISSLEVVRPDLAGGVVEWAYDQFGGDFIPWIAPTD